MFVPLAPLYFILFYFEGSYLWRNNCLKWKKSALWQLNSANIPLAVSALLLKSQKHCIFLCNVSIHEYLCIYSPSVSLLSPHTHLVFQWEAAVGTIAIDLCVIQCKKGIFLCSLKNKCDPFCHFTDTHASSFKSEVIKDSAPHFCHSHLANVCAEDGWDMKGNICFLL